MSRLDSPEEVAFADKFWGKGKWVKCDKDHPLSIHSINYHKWRPYAK